MSKNGEVHIVSDFATSDIMDIILANVLVILCFWNKIKYY